MSDAINIVIVDDHPIFRRGMIALLEEPDVPAIHCLGEANDAVSGLRLVEQYQPDVLLTDLQLDNGFTSALDLIRATRERSPATAVLVMTAFDDPDVLLQVLQAGAHGCISKADQLESAAIRHAIGEVASGGHAYSPLVFKRLYQMLQRGGGPARPAAPNAPPANLLTEREQEVLALIANSATNQQIADQLTISLKTVKTHVSNILNKLQLQSRYEAALYYRANQQQQS